MTCNFNSLTAFRTPTDTLLRPIPDVEDFPTDDALRLGKTRLLAVRALDVLELADGVLKPNKNF